MIIQSIALNSIFDYILKQCFELVYSKISYIKK